MQTKNNDNQLYFKIGLTVAQFIVGNLSKSKIACSYLTSIFYKYFFIMALFIKQGTGPNNDFILW